MKKLAAIILSLTIIMGIATSCGSSSSTTATVTEKTTAAGAEATSKEAVSESTKGESVEAADLPVIRMGLFDSRTSFVTWYIIENGLDVKNGFRIEPVVSTAGGSFLNEAIGAGQLDMTNMGSAQAVYSASVYDCINVAEISEASGSSVIFARPDSPEAQVVGNNPEFPEVRGSAETLKGKTFMYPTGSMSQLTVAKYLEVFGLTLDDVTSTNTNYGPGYQALQAGEGDTITLFSPLTLTAINDGYVALASLDQLKTSVRDCLMVTPEAYANAELMSAIKKYIKVLFEENDKMQADKAFQQEQLAKFHAFYGNEIADPSMLTIEIDKHYLLTSGEALSSIDKLGESCLTIGQYYYDIGLIEEDALEKIKTNVDKTIVPEVLGN